MTTPTVGQTIYALNTGNNARNRKQILTPMTVKKVGRKYFQAAQHRSMLSIEFELDGWNENGKGYCPNWKAYATKQEWEDEEEKGDLLDKLGDLFRYGRTSIITLDQLRAIKVILQDAQTDPTTKGATLATPVSPQ